MYITLKNRFTLYLFIIQELSRLDFVSVDHSNERDIGRQINMKFIMCQCIRVYAGKIRLAKVL